MARFWTTCLRASLRERRCHSIKYARTKVVDLLTPMMQCTSTLPLEKDGKCEVKIEKNGGQTAFEKKTRHHNIYINFTIFAHQGFVYEFSCRFEVLTEVKVLRILRWDAEVNTGVHVKILVPDAALLGVRCVQDMSDAELM